MPMQMPYSNATPVICTFCNSNCAIFCNVQLLDAVMNMIEPGNRYHRTEVSSAYLVKASHKSAV